MELHRLWICLAVVLCTGFTRGLDVHSDASKNPLLVRSTSGLVSGFLDINTTSVALKKWLGIPFAQTTAGKNRWKPPKRIVPEYSSVFNASLYGPACLQGRYVAIHGTQMGIAHWIIVDRADGGNGTAIQSEDCLRINVIAPSEGTNLPVYLYSQ
jgi:carboxylesterase type B